MAKRQSHKQSRIGKEMEAAMALEMLVSDPAQKQMYKKHIQMLRDEWEQAGWERRFPNHDRDGKEIKPKQDEAQNSPD